jgi:hypothetical protein
MLFVYVFEIKLPECVYIIYKQLRKVLMKLASSPVELILAVRGFLAK